MMAIGKLVKGRGARGLLEYLLGPTDHNGEVRPRADVVGGTFGGRDVDALAREFAHLHRLRPRLGVHVAHMSLRFAPEDRALSDAEQAAIGEYWGRGMGFDGFVVISHGDHIHVAASRVTADGQVVSDQHDWRRSEALVRQIEERWNLTRVQSSHLLEPERAVTHRKAPTLAEIALAEKGEAPLAEQVRDILEAALTKPRTVTDFVAFLELHGVEVLPNVASTGKLNGFAYRYGGQEFTAKGLGRGFTLANMQKRGLAYEPHRDLEAINRCRARDAARLVGESDHAPAGIAAAGVGAGAGAAGDPRTDPGGSRPGADAAGGGHGSAHGGDAEDAGNRRDAGAGRIQGGADAGADRGSRSGGVDQGNEGRRDQNGEVPERGLAAGAEAAEERRRSRFGLIVTVALLTALPWVGSVLWLAWKAGLLTI
jgi:hypothetical protein